MNSYNQDTKKGVPTSVVCLLMCNKNSPIGGVVHSCVSLNILRDKDRKPPGLSPVGGGGGEEVAYETGVNAHRKFELNH